MTRASFPERSTALLRNSTFLLTGGTGSFGRAFLRYVLSELDPARVVIYSRDELKQHELALAHPRDHRIETVIGDIRDLDRLRQAMRGIEHVVHAAALKQVDTAERHAFEYTRTNIIGSQNVVEAAIAAGVGQVVALSTDKASSPVNLYGATKMVADKLFTSADCRMDGRTRFAVVRYGNVMGSRGSVVPVFRHLAATGRLPITDRRMTRFFITLDQAVRFVAESFTQMRGGELFVPRIPSARIEDLATAIAPGCVIDEVGIRPGEKLHEEMIASEDSHRTVQLTDRYVVLPTLCRPDFTPPADAWPCEPGFAYRSDTNDAWLSVEELQRLLRPEPVLAA
jgi:UDP-N-acetylglucosamine 4,6-dehydratase/5-epimerase